MSWFKRSEEGDTPTTDGSVGGRGGPDLSRSEPREPRAEGLAAPPHAAESKPESRPADTQAPGPRLAPGVAPGAEALAPLLNSGNAKPESRPAPVRAPESRPAPVRTPEVRAPAPPPASVLGPTLRFRGELSAQEDLIVQGSVEGSIAHTQSLTIGTNGSMTGDIRARFIVIEGTVEGDLIAAESVHVRATAKVRGNMLAPRIAIEDGAFFQGRVQMQPVAAANAAPLEAPAVDQMLSGTGT